MDRGPRIIAAIGLALVLSGLCSFGSQAQNSPAQASSGDRFAVPIGKVESLAGEISIKHATGVVVQASTRGAIGDVGATRVGDAVYTGDIVQTGSNSKLGIAFTDGTAFNLSSNAHMVLDKYVYDPNGKSNATLFSLSKGAFTFIAGKIARTGDMKINTPVATMGIRGTAPHVEISEDGTVKFSTLIEENKNAASPGTTAPKARPPVGKRADRQTPSDRRDYQAQKEYDKQLNICRGC